MRMVDGHGTPVEVRLQSSGDGWSATVGERMSHVTASRSDDRLELVIDGEVVDYVVAVDRGTVWLGHGGGTARFDPAPARSGGRGSGGAAGLTLSSPMPGTVVSVNVEVGDEIPEGHPVVVVEAMKMEHTLRAPQAAVVREVAVTAGSRVDLRQVLVVLDAATESGQPQGDHT
jgi:acetyl/propionyl-CoA carboxylase alpha subunit